MGQGQWGREGPLAPDLLGMDSQHWHSLAEKKVAELPNIKLGMKVTINLELENKLHITTNTTNSKQIQRKSIVLLISFLTWHVNTII